MLVCNPVASFVPILVRVTLQKSVGRPHKADCSPEYSMRRRVDYTDCCAVVATEFIKTIG